jgi:peroxiredoxin
VRIGIPRAGFHTGEKAMVAVHSTMLPLGVQAPDFRLQDTEGGWVSRADFAGQPLLVAFICNHCPFVVHIAPELARFGRDMQAKGVGMVGINSNDTEAYPDDAPPRMREEKRSRGYVFPYLLDETQAVAKAYQAACTPDFYLFDRDHRLVYRGRFDETRPQQSPPLVPHGRELRAAVDALLAGKPISPEQSASIGCNIKWKPGNAPDYFGVRG